MFDRHNGGKYIAIVDIQGDFMKLGIVGDDLHVRLERKMADLLVKLNKQMCWK